MASHFLNARKFVSLMVHKGALIKDKSGLLEGDGKEGRVARFIEAAGIQKEKKALEGSAVIQLANAHHTSTHGIMQARHFIVLLTLKFFFRFLSIVTTRKRVKHE